jgi:hypothetical protein
LNGRELALAVAACIQKEDFVHVYVADGPSLDGRLLRWIWPKSPRLKGYEDEEEYAVLVAKQA